MGTVGAERIWPNAVHSRFRQGATGCGGFHRKSPRVVHIRNASIDANLFADVSDYGSGNISCIGLNGIVRTFIRYLCGGMKESAQLSERTNGSINRYLERIVVFHLRVFSHYLFYWQSFSSSR